MEGKAEYDFLLFSCVQFIALGLGLLLFTTTKTNYLNSTNSG